MNKKVKKINEKNLIDWIIQYECEVMSEEQTIEFFAYLIKTGKCWSLQGHYGRMASYLIDNKVITKRGEYYKM